MSQSMPDPQVLIIGGGIVGLSASLFLSQHSVSSLLIERHSGTSIHPRARSVNARTMELYRSLGIDDVVREAGKDLSLSGGIYKGETLVSVIEPRKRKESSGPRTFNNPFGLGDRLGPVDGARGTQDLIEPVLLKAARERGVDVRFRTEFVSSSQDETGIEATIREQSTGVESKVRAKYMIAADGAGSLIRTSLNVPTTGVGSQGHLLNILFEADLQSFVQGREFSMCYIEQASVRGLFTSINNKERWVFHLSYSPSLGETPDDFPPEKCEKLVGLALGMDDVKVAVKSILPWEPTVRVVTQLQHNRIFLVGDAAHTMPPWGGQGANSGIADVHNLAWKLGLVLNHDISPKLLETYNVERQPVGKLVADESGMASDGFGLINWGGISPLLAGLKRAPRLLGFGYSYSSSSVNEDDDTPWYWRNQSLFWRPLGWILSLDGRAGTRCPHVWVVLDGKRISTLDIFGRGFVMLAGNEGKGWIGAAKRAEEKVGIQVKAYVVGEEGGLRLAQLLSDDVAEEVQLDRGAARGRGVASHSA